ncbi:testicular haploid expressed gene protein isoform X7 [Hippopotamus amphibius kiboko]|uniref:testicular haploid expressed gene protein isoform X7 n=1 Tax=Hippopotamus amphibius kiboko TaxID=575201 RepID=UPI0025996FF1|nr:testicular haploid expressed gene protein isoform X7 [Hippopotamus amphibius kiboko]
MWAENGGGPFSCCLVTTDTSGCCGSKAAGRGRAQPMGDRQQNSLYSHRTPEAEDGPERAQDGGTLGLQGTVYESRGSRDPKHQDLGDGDLGLEDQEEETLPEVVTGEESVDTQNPEEALLELERVLEKDAEDGVPEMRGPRAPPWGGREGRGGGCFNWRSPRPTGKSGKTGRGAAAGATPGSPPTRGTCSSVSIGHRCTGRRGFLRTPPSPSQCLRCPAGWRSWPDLRGSARRITAATGTPLGDILETVHGAGLSLSPRVREESHTQAHGPRGAGLRPGSPSGPPPRGPFPGPPWSTERPAACETWPPRRSGITSGAYTCLRCPTCPGQRRWPPPVRGSSDWQSPGLQPPCWKSGTPCRNPSHTCQTITASFSWLQRKYPVPPQEK